jgi:hypothetical protein
MLKHFAPTFVLSYIACPLLSFSSSNARLSIHHGMSKAEDTAKDLCARWNDMGLHDTLSDILCKKLTAVSYSYFSWPGDSFEVNGVAQIKVPGNYMIAMPWTSECVVRRRSEPEFRGYTVMGFSEWPEFDDDQVQSLVLLPGLISSLFQSIFSSASDDCMMYVHDVKHFLEMGSSTLKTIAVEGQQHAQRLDRAFTRLQIQTESMLMALKEERRVITPNPVALDLDATISETVEELSLLASAARLDIRCSGLDTIGAVALDPALLAVATRNVVENAIRYATPGSAIAIDGRVSGEWIVLTFTSFGPAVSAEDSLRVFEKYYRARGTMGQTGTGVGLYIVRRIAEAHGGRASFSSSVDHGNTVELVLPLRRPAEHLSDNREPARTEP